ncbi:hypothetical protein PINS_up020679 [Pythium insidiosum]|nr:hypothetical protein PINS_up020679 [Pythium insidiosum]
MVYSLHALCAAYFVVAGMVYWGIPSTFLTWYIELYSLTIPLIYYHKIAVAHYVLASLHFFGLVYPVLGWFTPRPRDPGGGSSAGVQSRQRLRV